MVDISRRTLLQGASAVTIAANAPFTAPASAATVKASAPLWISTQSNAPWQIRTMPVPTTSGDPDMIIRTNEAHQMIEGMGACFNELGWDALTVLSPKDQATVFDALFTSSGANFNLCRMPIGANDFARDWYSLAETPGDFALKSFSIARDKTSLIPFITEARKRRPDLKLWASPWSPPAWMKTNGHYAAKSAPNNGLPTDRQGAEGTDMFIQDDRHLKSYADYFARFVAAYKAQGIAISAVMPQNEFNSDQIFPSCTWTPAGLARFIPHLGQALLPHQCDILFGTMERPDTRLFDAVYTDPAARPYIKGIGLQWAGKGAAARLNADHPALPIWQTEQECGDGKNDWRYCRYAWTLMKHYFNNGATAYQYWNMSLKKGGVSRWGWAQNSLVTVDETTRSFTFNPEFYLMKHVSHFVQKGARRVTVQSWKGYENALAFRNPEGSVVLVAQNDMADEMPVTVQLGEQFLKLVLPGDSFNTIYVPNG